MSPFLSRAAELVVGVLRIVGGIAAGFLPRRIWRRFDGELPIRETAVASAVAGLAVGFCYGFFGFLSYAIATADRVNDAVLDVARRQAAGTLGGEPIGTSAGMFLTPFTAITYAIATPHGLLASYLAVSNVVRLISAIVREPHGDPVLTLGDLVVRRTAGRARERHETSARERLEGPAVPDLVVTGESFGLAGADWVVIASRRKPDWTEGTVVLSGERCFRVGRPFDRTLDGRLRAVYPLIAHPEADVLRRWVAYDVPPS